MPRGTTTHDLSQPPARRWSPSCAGRQAAIPRASVPCVRTPRAIYYLLVLVGCLSAGGCCTTYYNALRTLVLEPADYCFKIDGCNSLAAYRDWAERELREQSQSCGEAVAPADYRDGFIEGFVEYVHRGGTGEPPPVPPRRYWNIADRSLAGRERVNEWYAGYRSGARTAHEGGYRAAGVIQSSYFGQGNYFANETNHQSTPPLPASLDPPAAPPATAEPAAAQNTNATNAGALSAATENAPKAGGNSGDAPPSPPAADEASLPTQHTNPFVPDSAALPDDLTLPITQPAPIPPKQSAKPEAAEESNVTVKRAKRLFAL
jgi:hypothetical protein